MTLLKCRLSSDSAIVSPAPLESKRASRSVVIPYEFCQTKNGWRRGQTATFAIPIAPAIPHWPGISVGPYIVLSRRLMHPGLRIDFVPADVILYTDEQ